MPTRSHRLCDSLRGRWSPIPPNVKGVYFARAPSDPDSTHVLYWQPRDWNSDTVVVCPIRRPELEFLYLEDDVDGVPSRADDRRVLELAIRNRGRREPPRGR
jgi:hypothetical protein